MMSLCTTSGYPYDVIGPYYSDANYNDAKLLDDIVEKEHELMEFIGESKESVFVLDRGFRDCKDKLEDQNIAVMMPAFKEKSKQLNTPDANESRLVTKLRWKVEAYHGRLKTTWPFLKFQISNHLVPVLPLCVKICTAALNAFRAYPCQYHEEEEQEALKMLDNASRMENSLSLRVLNDKGPLTPRNKRNWTPMDSAAGTPIADDFPALSLVQLRQITFGPYQLERAKYYAKEHLNESGDFRFDLCKVERGLLRCQIQSRHSNALKYNLAVKYNSQSIIEYCCSCTPGQRTVGCCSHVATILWFLGYGRHKPEEMLRGRKHSLGTNIKTVKKGRI